MVVLLRIILLFQVCVVFTYGYKIIVEENLQEDCTIFNFTGIHKKFDAILNPKLSQTSALYYDKQSKSLRYSPAKSSWTDFTSFEVTLRSKNGKFESIIPFFLEFEASFIKNSKKNILSRQEKAVNVFLKRKEFERLLRRGVPSRCPNSLTPATLCSCPTFHRRVYSSRHLAFDQTILECRTSNFTLPPQVSRVIVHYSSGLSHTFASRGGRRRRGTSDYVYFQVPNRSVRISENLPAGSPVTTMRAYARNEVATQNVVYRLEPRQNRHSLELFRIDPHTGVITTNSSLDREDMSIHFFNVFAVRPDINQARGTLKVYVIDVNDNSPIFERPSGYNVAIRENQAIRTQIQTVKADDADSGKNGELTYSIVRSVPHTNAFAITQEGNLIVNGLIDREAHSQYLLTIAARDQGSPSRNSTVPVTVTIEDVNDNHPQFTRAQYNVRVYENARVNSIIANISATDADSGMNGLVSYVLYSGRRTFRINPQTGEISLIARLDYEVTKRYQLRVRATDNGRPALSNTSGLVNVQVLDINDNTPHFISSPYNKVVLESAPVGSKILQVEAEDGDALRSSSRIAYTILNRGSPVPFRIDLQNGTIQLSQKLDHERQGSYTFTVQASDHGSPRRTATTQVTINVRDVNDNAPYFTSNSYQKRVAEDMALKSPIINIEARDPDTDATISISYRIIAGNQDRKFSIISRNGIGKISLAKALDYNEQRHYRLTVEASDGSLKNTTFVYINVTDTNSHTPIFEPNYYPVTLPENVPIGHLVVQVHAVDGDIGDNARITYCFSDAVSNFQINSNNGEIRTRQKLDFDNLSKIMLGVIARDNGIPPEEDRAVVEISLTDINDNAPVFQQTKYQGEVSEDSRVSQRVLTIHATDRDSSNNGEIRYTFEGGNNGNGYFSVDPHSGDIRTALPLDREHIDKYDLVAFAVDQGTPKLSSSVAITINILDVDDNPPTFKNDTLYFKVKEDVDIGHVVARIKATDPDQTTSDIIYDIGHDPEVLRYWKLNPDTGELATVDVLDYERKRNYTFIVSALSNELVSQATVHILVQDCNDNNPVLSDFEIVFNNYRTRLSDSFPVGVIGEVPAYDPDVSDTLTYRFLSGNDGKLLLLQHNTGEIGLNKTALDSNRQFSTRMRIEVSDGLHRTPAWCTLRVTGITDEMLSHSITVRVLHMNAYSFLSPLMYSFIDGLANILNTTSKNVFVFNVQNDTDVKHEILNVSFSAKKERGEFFTSKYLQDQVYLNRQRLSELTTRNVLPFDDNICLREPCQNYKRCSSVLTFDSTAPFVSSRLMIFRPIYPVYKLKCECPIGFTNDIKCADEINMCYSSPCVNNGKCLSREGGFTCICREGFAGERCEINMKQGRCIDYIGVCRNGGQCVDGPGSDEFHCVCAHPNHSTATCELRSREFNHGSFLMMQGITNQWHFTLSISFSTTQENGLLFYNGRLNHEHDFIVLELVNGQVQLNFSTGQNWDVVQPFVDGGLNDGTWHTAKVEYYNERKPGPLPTGIRSRYGPSHNKVAILTIDPDICDPMVAQQWNETYGTYSCSKQVKQMGQKSSLDLTSPLFIGGVPDLPEDFQVRSKSFTGCIRDLYLDGKILDLDKFITKNGSLIGCPSTETKCRPNSCYNGGTCTSTWEDTHCDCKDEFTGKKCQHQSELFMQLLGVGCVEFTQKNRLLPFKLPWRVQVDFRTRDLNAIILHVATAGIQMDLKIENGYLWYVVQSHVPIRLGISNAPINDGEWHHVTADWIDSGSQRVFVKLNLDYNAHQANVTSSSASLRQMSISRVMIGGKYLSGRTISPYKGCVKGLKLGPPNTMYPISDSSLRPHGGATHRQGCRVTDACRTHSCPRNSVCVSTWGDYECRCNTGYIGQHCTSVCSLNLCQNGGICRNNISATYGYSCVCPPGFRGPSCTDRYTTECPKGWYGTEGTCAPCKCSIQDNFDEACDKISGECICMSNHYFVSATGKCEPCGCYRPGSVGLSCTEDTGKCHCVSGVSGRQCNLCISHLAEITNDGCEVLYAGKCPRSFIGDVLWPRTDFGKQSPVKCPPGSKGIAYRMCDTVQGWLKPDFSGCVSDAYYSFGVIVEDLENNVTEMSSPKAIELASELSVATKSTNKLYKKDAINSFQIVQELLTHQSKQKDFGLAVAADSAFTDHVAEASSALLSNNSLHFWSSNSDEKHDSANPLSAPVFIKAWEGYTSTLLQNLHKIFYDSTVVTTDNINMSLYSVDRDISLFGYSYPLIEGRAENEVSVKLPKYLFSTVNPFNITSQKAVGVVTYNNLNKILPHTFEDDRTFRIPKKPSINSMIVSIQVYSSKLDHKPDDGMVTKLLEPVKIGFKLINAEAIEPQCVFWNFTTKSSPSSTGGWSQRGCTRSFSNKTHVTCDCYHLTTFAVVTDEDVSSVTNQLEVRIPMIIGVVVSMVFLLISFLCSLLLPGVKSIRALINRNITGALFLTNLIYLVGVQQTSNLYWCMAVAILLQFLLISAFSWIFVDGVHLYRVLTERRDINHGQARIYYLIGWVLPAIITALSIGLDAKSYGNVNFCWISFDDVLIWSLAGPVLLCCVIFLILLCLSVNAFLTSKRTDMKREEILHDLRASFFVTPVIMGTWCLAIFAVNLNLTLHFYLFSLAVALEGGMIFFFHCFTNKEVRLAMTKYRENCSRKVDHNSTTQRLLQSSMGRTPDSSMRDGPLKYNHSTSESISLNHQKSIKHSPVTFDVEVSDSEASDSYGDTSSDSSISLDSSTDDETTQSNTYKNIRNMRKPFNNGRNELPYVKTRGNGHPRNAEFTSSLRKVDENHEDEVLTDGSNETSL
uniref:cadherin EGF LAG seven-pass G-type receptor 2 isoform X2 n=1 Tax=Ciona intestinalis TaxID=7719 RepID=UPI000180D202|nr:cadherin EGF LAG seven-pass G-type receptor 2 isoform X2 [Ciona intestinalis]|eukprot:XP_002124366.1 cadherin EGF LAG seven-pass G-type receptor 2 isoform X2 [Ciona intestinalis]